MLFGGPYPFFQTGDVKAAAFYLQDYQETYSEKGLAQSRMWPAGTLCITIAANIAETAVLGIPGCFPDSIVGFLPNPDLADVAFVKYSFDVMKLEMQAASRGTTQDNLPLDKLLTFPFQIPPLVDQRKIAAVLLAYDELIESNLRRIEILEEMAQELYREWFVNFRFPGYGDIRFVESDAGPIPAGWSIESLSTLTTTQYGFTESTSVEPVGPRFLRGMDLNKRSFIDWSAVPYCPISDEDYKKFRLHPEDIVVIRMADPGKAAIVEEAVDAVFASYLVRVIPDRTRMLPYFLFHYFQSPEYQGYINGASTGTTRKSASAGVLTGSLLVLPPVTFQERFVEVVRPIRKLLTTLVRANANLRKTRDLLLPRLISGDVDLSSLDIDTSWLAA